jgi:FkbM family methyltransferase
VTFLSYAQNGEDVVLARAFDDGHQGFYVDIGAADPVSDSVTKLFYDAGWSGIDVEPASRTAQQLRDARPRDLTLEVAVGDRPGERTFYEVLGEHMGNSSLVEAYAADHGGAEGMAERAVEVVTLAQLWDEHVGERTVDFLKIDVEGSEAEVLAGADLARHRPRVLVVEATRPGTSVASHEEWEPGVLDTGYALALFDGLNRFYVREEDATLRPALAVPANVLDDYVPYRYQQWHCSAVRADAELATARAELEGAATRASGLETALTLTREELARSQAGLRDAQAERDAARAALRTIAVPARTNNN